MVQKPRCSKLMRKAIENAAVHNGNKSDKKEINMKSGDWEREGTPTYPKAIAYCSMTVQDLEHDQQA